MATLTLYSGSADDSVYGYSSSYSTARSTAYAIQYGSYIHIGQAYQSSYYYCYESFIQFATGALSDSAIISAATLSLYGSSYDYSYTDFTITAAIHDWSTSVDTGDWVAGASLSSKTTVATFNTSGFNTSGYNVFTDVALPANVSKTSDTRLILYSSRHSDNNTPSSYEYLLCCAQEYGGNTYAPKLVITYTLPVNEIKKVAGVSNV